MTELRRLLRVPQDWREDRPQALPFGIAMLDSHLPEGGLAGGALHEIVPATAGESAAAFGFLVAILGRLPRAHR